MNISEVIRSLVLLLLLILASMAKASQSQPLSVLLITIDNLRPDRMSVYGYDQDTTPYLKQFASESIIFERAFSTSAWTAPGMVSIFTGYYPPVHAQHGRFSFYDETMSSALRVLASHGYEILGQGIRGPSHQGFGFQKLLGRRPDRLASFIEDRIANSTPFFAWAHIKDVHLPYSPSQGNAELFRANLHSSAAIEAVKQHRIILRHPERVDIDFEHAGKVSFDDKDIETVNRLYDAEVADVDDRLRGYLERMREIGLLDRTIVIISADHGEELFEHGWLGHASTGYDAKLYDELIRIPLIIRVPGSTMRGHFDAMVQGVDFMPTIFELLGIDAREVNPRMQGRTFVPVIKGELPSIRDHVFNQTTVKGWTTPLEEMQTRIVSVRSEDKKLIVIPGADGTRIEAFDLANDPQEKNNIYSEQAGAFRDLEQALDIWNADNRTRAARLVIAGAQRRIDGIVDAVLGNTDLDAAVSEWSAIRTMEKTWGLEPEPFFQQEPYASQWQKLQRLAAGMIGAAMTCRANGGMLRTTKPEQPRVTENWKCTHP